jgi:antirestriction protein ArdC
VDVTTGTVVTEVHLPRYPDFDASNGYYRPMAVNNQGWVAGISRVRRDRESHADRALAAGVSR